MGIKWINIYYLVAQKADVTITKEKGWTTPFLLSQLTNRKGKTKHDKKTKRHSQYVCEDWL